MFTDFVGDYIAITETCWQWNAYSWSETCNDFTISLKTKIDLDGCLDCVLSKLKRKDLFFWWNILLISILHWMNDLDAVQNSRIRRNVYKTYLLRRYD